MNSIYRARFPNTRRAAALARRAIVDHVARYGYRKQDLSDIETAAGEALANAVEHGHRDESGFEVRIAIDATRIVIEVQDDGTGFHTPSGTGAKSPGHDAPRGFGIYLMHHLMDEVEFTERGTCVRLTKRLPVANAEGSSVSCG
jgi:serine/threonine-protein kinase RsbW